VADRESRKKQQRKDGGAQLIAAVGAVLTGVAALVGTRPLTVGLIATILVLVAGILAIVAATR
jgi:uncharacterized membrane-anchored protein